MPAIREGLVETFGLARLRMPKNTATVISEGSAWIGHDRVDVCLAKPFEVLHANDSYVSLVHGKTILPTEGQQIQNSVSMYCVDPRDGYAKFQLTRPRWPGRESTFEPRLPYAHLTLNVDPFTEPLLERLELKVNIDHNLIAHVTARSEGRNHSVGTEILDLEFGLGVADDGDEDGQANATDQQPQIQPAHITPTASNRGTVRIRSNIAEGPHAWHAVPGEVVQSYRPNLPDQSLTPKQHDEKMYYKPCLECGRSIYEIERDGCDECAREGRAISTAEAKKRREELQRQGMSV